MAETALSPYFTTRPSREGLDKIAVLGTGVSDSVFAFGGEVVSRPSATARYIVSDLELEFEAPHLAYGSGTMTPKPLAIRVDKDRGHIIVEVLGSKEIVDQAVVGFQTGRGIWDLQELAAWLSAQTTEDTPLTAKVIAKPDRTTLKSPGTHSKSRAADRGEGTAEAILDAPEPQAAAVSIVDPPPTDPAPEERFPHDAGVTQLATRISELTQLPDGDLAQLFPGQVSRETYQRWRTGRLDNPTAANRRRMWFLLRLFEGLVEAGVSVRDWVRNPTTIQDLTPFELLKVGRFDEVEHLAARTVPARTPVEVISSEGRPVLLEHGPPGFTPRSDEPSEDLVFEEEDDWVQIEGEMDDE